MCISVIVATNIIYTHSTSKEHREIKQFWIVELLYSFHAKFNCDLTVKGQIRIGITYKLLRIIYYTWNSNYGNYIAELTDLPLGFGKQFSLRYVLHFLSSRLSIRSRFINLSGGDNSNKTEPNRQLFAKLVWLKKYVSKVQVYCTELGCCRLLFLRYQE